MKQVLRARRLVAVAVVAVCGIVADTARAGDIALQVEGGPAAAEIQAEIEGWAPGTVAFVGFGLGEVGARINKPRARGDLIERAAEDGRTNGAAVVVLIRMVSPKAAYVLAIDTAGVSTILDQQVPLAKKTRRRRGRRRRGGAGGGRDLSALKRALQPVFNHAANASGPSGGGDVADAGGGGAADGGGGGDSGGGGGGKGGSADWGNPDWAGSGGGGSSSSSSLLGDSGDSGDEDEAEEEKEEDDDDSGSSVSRTRRRRRSGGGSKEAGIVIEPVYALTGRKMEYAKRETRNLRPYDAKGISVVGAEFEVYPGAFFSDGIASKIGIGAGYGTAVGLSSSPKEDEGIDVGTTYSAMNFDVRGRFLVNNILLTPRIGYGAQSMQFDADGDPELRDTVPDVSYGFVRAGLDARFGLDPVGVLFGLSYRHNLSTGIVGEEYFPSSSTIAFDLNAGVAYEIMSFLEARVHFDVAYVGYTFNAGDEDQYVAESAYDAFFGARFGLAAFF